MLHVVNGDETAARLAPVALPGEVLVWRDILIEGPVAADHDVDALAAERAPWLAARFGIPADEYRAAARAEADGLARARAHDEVVLWFEQDLFCVANLAHLAAWIERTRPAARVTLVFPEDPLGRAAPETLRSLFEARAPFDAHAVEAAAAWWRGFCAADPRAFPAPDDGALVFLAPARLLHLARFPSITAGLGAVEAAALHALGEAPVAFPDLFHAVTRDARMRRHGMGDVQVAAYLAALAAEPEPLVTIDGGPPRTPRGCAGWQVALTATGRAVRDGARDRLDTQRVDWWLGGVVIDAAAPWRWDGERERLVSRKGPR